MDLAKLLSADAVKFSTTYTSKKRLFQDIAEVAEAVHGLKASTIVNALQERETLGPTGVGGGIALPHARLADATEVVGVFVRCEKPFEFRAVDRKPVDLIFSLLAPEDAGVEHLKALALVSRTMRSTALCEKLRANTDTATLHALLMAGEETQAA